MTFDSHPVDLSALDTLWTNARLATMAPGAMGLGIIESGCIGAKDGRILYVGDIVALPADARAKERIDCGGRWITPGLVDCHTHLIYGGNRASEFAMRLEGASYEDISRAGGGIASSMKATRAASEAQLVAGGLKRLDHLLAEGVTTVEIKSGYGLDKDTEIRCLQAARQLGRERNVSVVTSFLGAHAMPPEANGDKDTYIDIVIAEMLPTIAELKLADAVDAFCESIAFSPEQTARVFAAAHAYGIPVKLHADQLSNLHGAKLAAEHGALSADHLEHTDEDGVIALTKAGTVAVVLPGAYYTLRETQAPPIALFRKHGTHLALATDSNPGTSPLTSLLLTMNMAATLFRMTVDECLLGVTREGARALGKLGEIGTLEAGKFCDLAIWDIEHPAELVYRVGFNPLHARVRHGRTHLRS
jgi:imidazolonepropionase